MTRTLALLILLLTSNAWAAAPAAPDDAQIAHIAYTAGQLDIDAARQALDKTTDPAVRAFAQTMLRDHTAVNEQAMALLTKLKVTPQNNPTSQALSKSAAETLARQSALSGGEFDRAYVVSEAAYHQQVNDALRTVLIPGAQNAELKALLEAGLALFSEHQKHAEALAAEQAP